MGSGYDASFVTYVVWRLKSQAYIIFGCLKFMRARRTMEEECCICFSFEPFIRELTIKMEWTLPFAYAVIDILCKVDERSHI